MRRLAGKLWQFSLIILLVPSGVIGAEAQNAFNEGVKLYQAGKFKDAVAAFNRAVKAAPKSDEAFNNRGLAYFKLGQIDMAVKDYDESIKLNAKSTDAFFNRGNAHPHVFNLLDSQLRYAGVN